MVFIPLAVLISFIEPVLIFLKQDPVVAEHAQQFIILTLPWLYLIALFDLYKRFLNCMTKSYVPMVAMLTTLIVHPLLCYLFVVVLEYDIVGIGIAYNLS